MSNYKKHPKFDIPMKTFWDTFEGRYQMGEQKHRLYMLDLLTSHNVKTLLDVGCGTAPIFELLRDDLVHSLVPRWGSITRYKGTDYSPAMIKICNEEFPGGDFEVQDARDLSEGNDSWECVLLMHALDHLDDYKAAIAEAARVSSKYVCIILWRSFVSEGTNLNDRNMYGKEEGDEPWEDTHLQEYSRKALQDEFDKNKLRVVKEVSGEELNSDASHYNWLVLLEKYE